MDKYPFANLHSKANDSAHNIKPNRNPPHAIASNTWYSGISSLSQSIINYIVEKWNASETLGTSSTPECTVPAQIQFLSIFQRCRSLKLNCNLIKSMFCWVRSFSALYTVLKRGCNQHSTAEIYLYLHTNYY